MADLARLTLLLAVLLPLLFLAACGGSARRGEPVAPPLNLSAEAQAGERAFMAHCNECHPRGEAGLAFAINNKPLPAFLIRYQVRRGVGAMPAFAPAQLSDRDLDRIIVYLAELRHQD